MGVIVALCLTGCSGTARFLNVKHKAQSNAFLYIVTLIPPLRRECLGISTIQNSSVVSNDVQDLESRRKDTKKSEKRRKERGKIGGKLKKCTKRGEIEGKRGKKKGREKYLNDWFLG